MNKRGHVIDAVLRSAGLAVLLSDGTAVPTLRALLVVGGRRVESLETSPSSIDSSRNP